MLIDVSDFSGSAASSGALALQMVYCVGWTHFPPLSLSVVILEQALVERYSVFAVDESVSGA